MWGMGGWGISSHAGSVSFGHDLGQQNANLPFVFDLLPRIITFVESTNSSNGYIIGGIVFKYNE